MLGVRPKEETGKGVRIDVIPGKSAAKAGARGVILHDAGVGLDEAGIGSLAYLQDGPAGDEVRQWFDGVADELRKRVFDPPAARPGFFGLGGVAMALLTFLQYRFPWWPLHPIGLPICAVWMVRNQAAAIFIAWAAKSLVMRFGDNLDNVWRFGPDGHKQIVTVARRLLNAGHHLGRHSVDLLIGHGIDDGHRQFLRRRLIRE